MTKLERVVKHIVASCIVPYRLYDNVKLSSKSKITRTRMHDGRLLSHRPLVGVRTAIVLLLLLARHRHTRRLVLRLLLR